jgi:RNA polymerase sigma-70 factor (ECF subfamily)
LAGLHHSQYGSLFRLATLLTGDVGSAEAAVVESFVLLQRRLNRLRPLDDALAQLLRLLVARSRVRGRGPWRADRPAPADVLAHRADRQGTIALENSPMTRALRALPAGQREAIVLTHYLDLTDEQAAAAMRVSRATLRRRLSEARSALRGALPVNGAESAGSLSSGGHGSREPIVKSAWQ